MPEELEKTTETTPVIPTSKTFSEDYVKSIREEAKESRLAKKAVEAKFKTLLGLKDDEDLDDSKISAYQARQIEATTAQAEKSNARLILAEIKSLDGYDTKLVERLLDKKKLTIADDDTVTGLKEAVEALALEFPQIKVENKQTAANPVDKQKTEDAENAKMRKAMGLPTR